MNAFNMEQVDMTTSRDCLTTEKKIAFMQKAMSPDVDLFAVSDRYSDSKHDSPLCKRDHSWNFDRYYYELRPRKLADAEKIEKALDCLRQAGPHHSYGFVGEAIAILKGESHG